MNRKGGSPATALGNGERAANIRKRWLRTGRNARGADLIDPHVRSTRDGLNAAERRWPGIAKCGYSGCRIDCVPTGRCIAAESAGGIVLSLTWRPTRSRPAATASSGNRYGTSALRNRDIGTSREIQNGLRAVRGAIRFEKRRESRAGYEAGHAARIEPELYSAETYIHRIRITVVGEIATHGYTIIAIFKRDELPKYGREKSPRIVI